MAKRKTTPKKKTLSGGARMAAKGRKAILLGVNQAEYDLLKEAAERERRPITQFLLVNGLDRAKKLLGKSA